MLGRPLHFGRVLQLSIFTFVFPSMIPAVMSVRGCGRGQSMSVNRVSTNTYQSLALSNIE